MIKIAQIKLPCGHSKDALKKRIYKTLRLDKSQKITWKIIRHSVDARKKPQLFDIYTVVCSGIQNEERVVHGAGKPDVSIYDPVMYRFPAKYGMNRIISRPVIAGAGPAGLFCALLLAENGYAPLLIERGKAVEQRREDVENFWREGKLLPGSNVQFGEGGAGTFSDGKLNTQVGDRDGRIAYILQTFAEMGADRDILYEAKPHIGTDVLCRILPKIRKRILQKGGEIRFESQLTNLFIENGKLKGIEINHGETMAVNCLILAVGHSARDTFRMLRGCGIPMIGKDFAVGFRVAHPQHLIDESQYGFGEPEELKKKKIPVSSYKLTARAASGRGVYSFCMCPGGYVVNASSEEQGLAVNGMSDRGRDSGWANSAIVMTVGKRDFGENDPMDGLYFQEKLERAAWELGKGRIPVQRFMDFKKEAECGESCISSLPESLPFVKGKFLSASLTKLLPGELMEDFCDGMKQFGRKINGFDQEDAYVIGLESRTSSPVRIPRDREMVSEIQGIYPCGEGAGYAGGIISAAIDGMKAAEAVAVKYMPPEAEKE